MKTCLNQRHYSTQALRSLGWTCAVCCVLLAVGSVCVCVCVCVVRRRRDSANLPAESLSETWLCPRWVTTWLQSPLTRPEAAYVSGSSPQPLFLSLSVSLFLPNPISLSLSLFLSIPISFLVPVLLAHSFFIVTVSLLQCLHSSICLT